MILEVNKFYYPVIGGVETVVKQYAELLSKKEKVIVLCAKNHFSLFSNTSKINNIKVIKCSSIGTFFSMPLSIEFILRFIYLSRKARIIHVHEPFPLSSISSIFLPKRSKIFITWHSDIIRQKFLKLVIEYFQKLLCEKAELIFSTSKSMKFRSSVLKKFQNKVKVLPLYLDPEQYLNVFIDNSLSKLFPKNYVLLFGRLSYYKGLSFFLKSIREIYDIPFLIVGDGEDKAKVLEFQKNRPNVLFINKHVSDNEKKDLIKNCKFLVLPSIYESEAFGIIQLEAMIYSKPVINTNLKTGVPWVSKHYVSGLTVPVDNIKKLSQAINLLYRDEILYKKLSKGAYNRLIKLFSNKRNETEILKFFS